MRRGRPPYPDVLTPREWEVVALIREGLTNRQIAQRLGISERGARFHVSDILSKLGVESREEAVRLVDGRRPALVALPFVGLLRLRIKGISTWRPSGAAALGIAVAGLFLLLFGLGWLRGESPGDKESANTEAAPASDAAAEGLRPLDQARLNSPYQHTILLSKEMPAYKAAGADLIASMARVETLADLQDAVSDDVNLIVLDRSAVAEVAGTTFLYQQWQSGRTIMGLDICVDLHESGQIYYDSGGNRPDPSVGCSGVVKDPLYSSYYNHDNVDARARGHGGGLAGRRPPNWHAAL